MVFKSKLFFSLKKSKSSGGTSNSPIGSDSSKEETRIPNRSLSSRLGSSKKKKKRNGSVSGNETLPPTSEEKRPSVASFLGFNRIKTRSSSLWLETFSSSGNHNAVTVRRGSGSDSVTSGSRSGSGLGSSEVCTVENLCELVNSRTRFPGDIKSYSHELKSNGLRDFPIWKPRGLSNLEELVKLIRTKFDKEKELVNLELIVFSWDLVALLDSQHEFQRQIEDLLVLARKCVETTPGDFWVQCEDIVQDLDDKRKELSPGVLKRLHTRILFILSRCTRLLQFHKERCEQEVGQLRQSRVLHLHSTNKKSAVSKEQKDRKVKPVKVVKNRVASGKEKLIICRICEEDVSASNVEDHSRICAFADKYDLKYASVDEHLVAVAVTLEKIIEKFKQKDSLAAVESPDGMKISNASLTEESDVLSPKLSDWSQRGSFDMLDYILEPDNSAFMDQGMATSSAGSMTPKSPIPTPRPDPIELLLFGGRFHEKDDIPQMSKLAEIARRAANVILDSDGSTYKLLLSCLRDLRDVLDCRFFDALIVETFGTRIEMFIEQKYLQLCNIVDDEKVDLSSTVIDEDAPLEDGIVRSLRTSLVHPWDGISIDDFQIQKEISRGAYGRVVLAKKRTTGDIFAIKILKKADMIRKKAVESTLAERDILINIRSPFVVRFFYSFTCPKKLYLVMEYVNGGDFYSLLKNYKCLDESNARVYTAEIVRALEDLHSKGVVHHDLKPDNLLIARNGHVKLTDFGVSKVGVINSTDDISGPVLSETSLLVEENPSEHQLDGRVNGSMKGTPDYLAPEILSGTEHGAAVDWWSVGIVLFELIVGVPPFHANNPEQIFENIRNGNITWPRVPEEMSHEARDLIDRLLTKDPKQRLGARGAAEVKQHIFFEGINWDTLAEQEPVFVPDIQDDLDTSFFESRYSSNPSDKGVDEHDILAEFEDSFNRFSVKNLAGLAHLNRDMIAS